MPRTQGHLWEQVIDWDALVAAYARARKGKRYKPDVLRFSQRWEEELVNLHEHLRRGTWQPAPMSVFPVYVPKYRVIEAPAFRDRIVHHALHAAVVPLFERRFIRDSYACRVGGGTHAATARVQHMLRRAQRQWGTVYVLQCDIKSYFPSIDHGRLLEQLGRAIRDERVLELWRRILAATERRRGIPIGALTSQLAANVYLDTLDHFAKDDLGLTGYVRYMDDFVVLGPSKADLWRTKARIETFIGDELHLALNPKTRMYPASQGVDFAGYRTWATHRLPRKRNVRAARRRFRSLMAGWRAGRVPTEQVRASVASYVGYLKHCQSQRTLEAILDDLTLTAEDTT